MARTRTQTAFLVAAAAAGVGLVWVVAAWRVRSERSTERKIVGDALATLTKERGDGVDAWARDLLGDARSIATFPSVREHSGAPRHDDAHLTRILDGIRGAKGRPYILVIAADGTYASGDVPNDVSSLTREAAAGAAPSHIAIGRSPPGPWAAAVVPILTERGVASGAVAVGDDPTRRLFPLLARPALSNETFECLLVARRGDEVAFLSPTRLPVSGSPDTPTSSDHRLPAWRAFDEPATVLEAHDYRGEPVLAAVRSVRPLGWGLVAKVDTASLAPAADIRAGLQVASGLALLAIVGLAFHETRRRSVERQLRATFEAAPAGMALTSPDGRLLRVNGALAAMLGRPAENLVGMRWDDLTHPDDRGLSADALRSILAGQAATAQYEKRYLKPDGSVLWALVGTHLLRDAAGRPEHFVTQVVDVTARRQADAELRDTAQKLQALFESGIIGVVFGDIEGGIRTVNDAYMRIVGYTREELARVTHWGELTAPEFRLRDAAAAAEARARGACTPYEKQYVRKDGSRVWALVGFTVLEPDRTKTVAFILDLTAQKTAQERARLLNTVAEVAPNAIVVTGADGLIEWVNPAFERLTGWTSAEAVGQNPRILKSGRTDPSVYQSLWRTISAGEIWRGELENRRKDGTTYVEEMTVTPLRGAGGAIEHYVAIKTDVTERRQFEDRLRQSQKMEAVGRLAGGLAHDFNNVLTAVLGFGSLARESVDPTSPTREFLNEVLAAGERAGGLTRQLLAFARRQPLRVEVLDLNPVVRGLETMLKRLLGEDISFVTNLEEPLLSVKADPAQLEQVLVNLAVNARDAMPDGGTLSIETRNGTLDEIPAVEVIVSDTGCGMDEAVRAHLFEPFFTTKEKGKGTGLGLATAYGIVSQGGGRITVVSEPGRGARFTVALPAFSDRPSGRKASQPRLRVGKGETVLLVEDEPAVRRIARRSLESLGYRVIEAEDGLDGQRVAETFPDEIHLLVSDVVMPHLRGDELARRLVASRPSLRVLLASGYAEEAVSLDTRPGDWGFLQKPYTPTDLAAKVREVLGAI